MFMLLRLLLVFFTAGFSIGSWAQSPQTIGRGHFCMVEYRNHRLPETIRSFDILKQRLAEKSVRYLSNGKNIWMGELDGWDVENIRFQNDFVEGLIELIWQSGMGKFWGYEKRLSFSEFRNLFGSTQIRFVYSYPTRPMSGVTRGANTGTTLFIGAETALIDLALTLAHEHFMSRDRVASDRSSLKHKRLYKRTKDHTDYFNDRGKLYSLKRALRNFRAYLIEEKIYHLMVQKFPDLGDSQKSLYTNKNYGGNKMFSKLKSFREGGYRDRDQCVEAFREALDFILDFERFHYSILDIEKGSDLYDEIIDIIDMDSQFCIEESKIAISKQPFESGSGPRGNPKGAKLGPLSESSAIVEIDQRFLPRDLRRGTVPTVPGFGR